MVLALKQKSLIHLRRVVALFLLLGGAGLWPGWARTEEPQPGVEEPEREPGEVEEPAGDPPEDPCAIPDEDERHWLDQLHERLFESVCSSSRWFDGFFGEDSFHEDFRRTIGRASADVLWDEYDGWDTRLRFRVKWQLPNLSKRAETFIGIGREDDSVLTDQDRGLDLIPGPFQETRDEDWLLGLGYHPQKGRGHGDWDVRVGVKLRFPLDPFLKVRYWRRWFFGDDALFRFTQTLFWRNELGAGATSNLEYEHFLGTKMLLRWRATGTVAEKEVEGWEWSSALTLYHGLTADDALSYHAIVRGESKDPETLEEYGFSATYRRRAFREWFFWQARGGVTWPREELFEEREAAPHVGAGIEIWFGRDGYRWRG